MLVIEAVGRDDLVLGAADDREATVVALVGAVGLMELAILGREVGGAFFIASDTDARGRPGIGVAAGVLAEATEPVGDARKVASSIDGFAVVDEDRGLDNGEPADFVGAIDVLRVAEEGLDDVEDVNGGFAVAGGDVADFLRVGAVGLAVVGGTIEPLALDGFAEPVPNVPESKTYKRQIIKYQIK